MRVDGAQRSQGFADGRGVMRKVVDDGDAGDDGAHFKAALDAFEAGQSGLNCFFADALVRGQRGGGRGVERVVFAGQRHFKFGPQGAVAPDFPTSHAVLLTGVAEILDAPVGGGGEAVALHAAKGVADALGDVGVAVVGQDQASAGNEIHETLESDFYGVEIGVDVSVVKFNVSEDERVRKIVQEFGPFIEEGGVVFIAFHDESARGTQLKTGGEIFSHAADEERRFKRGIIPRGALINPRQHAGCGGFAMRAGDHQRLPTDEKLLAQQGGHGGEGNPVVEHAFNLGVAAGERVADDDEVGSGIEIGFSVGLKDGNAKFAKEIAHGRIGGFVGAGDAMALQLQKAGQ